ncbi:MAG: 2'-5' RNA ligase family protein [Propionibacteriaceae bacterium]
MTSQLRSQYGLVSAGAFPPHATLVGSLPLAVGVEELVAVLDQVLASVSSFEVENSGVQRLGEVLVYNIHERDGQPNPDLLNLKSAVDLAARPLLASTPPGQLAADVHDLVRWKAHVSLATHELFSRPELVDEIEEYVTRLATPVPATFAADTVSLYRFVHPTWSGSWWNDMCWDYLRSWRLSTTLEPPD